MADELQVLSSQLPDNLEDLSKYVMVGREKLVAMQAAIRAINKVGLAEEIRKQKLEEAQDVADALLAAEVRLGELISELPESPGKRTDLAPEDSSVHRSKKEVLEEMGVSVKTAQRYEKLALHPEIVASISAESRDKGTIVSRTSVLRAIKQAEKTDVEEVPTRRMRAVDERGITQRYMISARKVMGEITIDPCASDFEDNVLPRLAYTKKDNGLTADWKGSVWLFPPYYDVEKFVDKLFSSNYTDAIVLVSNETETKWFSRLVEESSAMVFHAGKMRFRLPEGYKSTAPERGMVFFYLGNQPDEFLEEFSQYGCGARLIG